MKRATELLAELRALGVSVTLEGERLRLIAPPRRVSTELRDELARHKAELVELLAGAGARSTAGELRPRDRRDEAVLSDAQLRLWFLQQLIPGSSSYNIARAFHLRGELDRGALEAALADLTERHEVLRTTYRETDGVPRQVVHEALPAALRIEDLTARDDPHGEARRLVEASVRRAIDVEREAPLRVHLWRVGEEDHVLLFVLHHIAADGWSLAQLYRDLGEAYRARRQGKPPRHPPLPVQYADYAEWRQRAAEEGARPHLEYWERTLQGLAPLDLPTDHVRPGQQTFDGVKVSAVWPAELARALEELGRASGTTLYMTLLALFDVLLARYSGQEDVVVGSPVSSRDRTELEGLIGCFLNMVPVRVDARGEQSFTELLAQVRARTLEALEHRDLPFERIVGHLGTERDPSRNPLFQVFFAVQNAPEEAFALEGCRAEAFPFDRGSTEFDLDVHVWPQPDGLRVDFLYNRDLFDAPTVEGMLAALRTLAEAAVADPSTPVEELPLTRAETWPAALPARTSEVSRVQDLFLRRAAAHPDAVAVVAGDVRLRYAELRARAGILADRLRDLGVGRGDLVGLCTDRSADMLIGLLGILESGAAYVPLDPSFPAERLAFQLEDAAPRVLVTQRALADDLPEFRGARLWLDALPADGGSAPETSGVPSAPATADDRAYVIYTSGSTGRPKGVEITHGAVVNFLESMRAEPGLGPGDVLLAVTTLSFDIAVLELLLPVATGACVTIAPCDVVGDGHRLGALLEASGATVMQATPATWQMLLHAGWRGDGRLKMLCGGEALPRSLADELLSRGAELWNMYGPTETTIWSAVARVEADGRPIAIGGPIANTQLLVLDRALRPVPQGVPGELHIAGAGLARGYLGREDLTERAFVRSPRPDRCPGRLYKTGDLVRVDAAGRLRFLGRIDHQVKLRGYRIELGEIESVLEEVAEVRQAAVVLAAEGAARLVAFVSPASAAADPDGLRSALGRRLPDYMLPSVFVGLDALPLTPAGKLDRRALAASPVPDTAPRATSAPRTPLQEAVAEAFRDVLGTSRGLGVHESFFDLGGHSLLATQLVSRLRKLFGVEVALAEVFGAPTVAGVAECVERARGRARASKPIVPAPAAEAYPLSFSQRRLWFLDQVGTGAAYHMNLALDLEGEIDGAVLVRALGAIAARHDVLRTRFVTVDGAPFQVVRGAAEWPLAELDLSSVPGDEVDHYVEEAAAAASELPFDLERGPLMRATLLRLGPARATLILCAHHIVVDVWSLNLIARELAAHYEAAAKGASPELPALPVQYADFAVWQAAELTEEKLAPQLEYWRTRLSGELPVLQLPTDRARPAVQTYAGASHRFHVGAATGDALRALCREHGVTMAMVVQTCFQALLSRLSGQDDVLLGAPIAGRTRAEVEDLVGHFVNSLVLRADLAGDPPFTELLERTRASNLAAYDHQDLPFERLVEALEPVRDPSRSPLFQVVFAMQNVPAGTPQSSGLQVRVRPTEATVSRHDLELFVMEADGGLRGRLVYNTDLFDAATIERTTEQLVLLLEHAARHPSTRLSELPLLSEPERARITEAWSGTVVEHPSDLRTVPAEIVARTAEGPTRTALVCAGDALTYADLNARANRLARVLRSRGVAADSLVGVCVARGLDMVVAMLGVWKAGGAYLPLDPDYPRARLEFMLADSQVETLVTQERWLEVFEHPPANVLCLDRDRAEIDGADASELAQERAGPRDLAYAIYTSGSTGTPKAALLEHGGLWNVAHEQRRWFGVGPGTRVLQFSSFSFDAATFEIVMALASGATLFLGDRDELLPGPDLQSFLRRHAIGLVTLPPTALAALPPGDYPDLATITVAGEACSAELVERWAPGRRFFNLYGPTEATIWSTAAELRPGDRPHIGTPVGNTRAYVLDGGGRPVPVGVPGELHVGGAGVARGYWRRPELTQQRFLADPFVPGGRLYATGDLVRWRADGTIEFVGRADKQVKLRGHRIELEEVEAVLDRHAGVRSSLATVREDAPGDHRLVAYVVAEADDGDGAAPALESEQVDHWRTLYESSYSEADTPEERAFHIASWDSSYTGGPIPAEEMREWVDETVASIAALRPQRVLELGCGTGLLLFRLAGQCREYRGCDLSQAALDYVASELETVLGPDADRVTLEQRAADDLAGVPEGHFDVVVLNSVVQYFPSVDYLLRVLEGAARALRPGGTIFLGDVRNLALLEAFHTSVALHGESGDFDPAALRRRARRELEQDPELVLDPRLFAGLAERLPRLRAVALEPKRGRYDNELSRFRYDAFLGFDEEPAENGDVRWRDWGEGDDLAAVRERLEGPWEGALGWRSVPNARTERWARAVELVAGEEPPRSRERLEAELERGRAAVHPDDLRALAEELGLDCAMSWSAGSERGAFDAVFRPRGATNAGRAWTRVAPQAPTRAPGDTRSLANEPLHGRRMRDLVTRLREHAAAHLPATMIPSAFVTLDAFPVTPNGKLDRAALPPPGSVREELADDYRAPAGALQEALADVWARTLGLERVGARDNFFALGGDSILGIHLVAAAREAGLHFSAAQLFQHQTVASLAAVATLESARPAEQGPVTGLVPLTPIQHWFFEQELARPQHFNQALAFELGGTRAWSVAELEAALARLLDHHDALRARFRRTDGGWTQEFLERSAAAASVHDPSDLDPAEELRRIESLEAKAQAGLDLERGPLVRAELFRRPGARPDRLFLVVHHLVVDGISWRALLEDLETLLVRGADAALPPKTESFAAWSNHVRARAESGSTLQDLEHWRDLPWGEVRPLPTDRAAGPNSVASMDKVTAGLDVEETKQLLQLVGGGEARIDDYLLTAIARSLVAWSGGGPALIDVETHGRDDSLNLSRTVGWFTSMHPVLLRANPSQDAAAGLSSVREQLAAIPASGGSWGAARYLGPEDLRAELGSLPRAEVSYNYLGRLDATLGRGELLRPVLRDASDSRAPENERAHALEINGAVVEGELRVTWSYSTNLHDPATVRSVADSFARELRGLLAGPSALADFGWSDDQIGDILAELDRDGR